MNAASDLNRKLLIAYYAATAVFLVLDYFGGVNVRLAFLEALPAAKAIYYGICFFCLVLLIWRPGWTLAVSTIESLVTIVSLTLAIGARIFVISDEMIESGSGYVTPYEVWNYILAGGAAYITYLRGIRQLNAMKNL